MYVSTIKCKSKMNKQKLKEQGVNIFFYKKEIIEQCRMEVASRME